MKKLLLLITILLVPQSAAAAGLAKKDWPTWGGNSAHNKISPYKGKAPHTIYIRQESSPGSLNTFVSGPVVAHNTIYAIAGGNIRRGYPFARLIAYDLKGHKKWETLLPASTTDSIAAITVGDDGTVYTGYSKGLNAYDPSGVPRYIDACHGNLGASNIRMPVMASSGTLILQTGNSGDILACGGDSGNLLYKTTNFPSGGGQGNGGVAIDSQDLVYLHTQRGTQAVRAVDGSEVWRVSNLATGSTYNNYALSPDGKLLAQNDGTTLSIMDIEARNTSRGVRFQYFLGTVFGVFTFGLDNRIYVSVSTGADGNTGINGATIPQTGVTEFNGKICALNTFNGRDIWCYKTIDHLESSAMLVDSNNTVYAKDVDEHSVFAINKDGQLHWKYIVYVNTGGIDSLDSPAMTDDGKLFYADDYLYGFRPWTLAPKAELRASGSENSIKFTVHSSMLRRDPQAGVTTDNQAQVLLDGGHIVPLKYTRQDGDDSVWEGVYKIPSGTALSQVSLKGTVEAINYKTTTSLETRFSSIPTGFNNTGMVQEFDLGSAHKLAGTQAQTTRTSVSWWANITTSVVGFFKGLYKEVYDLVLR